MNPPPAETGGETPLVQFIVNNPGLADALLAQHVDDGSGHCRSCALGAQRGYHQHPCGIRSTAERARQIERDQPTRRLPGRSDGRGRRAVQAVEQHNCQAGTLIVLDARSMNRDDADMAVPEEIRMRLSHWCAARVPAVERDHRQVAYTIHGDAITILERRPPAYPELGPAWSATPVARLLRRRDGWLLERPAGRGEWRRDTTGSDPIALLENVRA